MIKIAWIGIGVCLFVGFVSINNADTEPCETPNTEDGECVVIEECPSVMELQKDANSNSKTAEASKFYVENSTCPHTTNLICCPVRLRKTRQPVKIEGNGVELLKPGDCGFDYFGGKIIGGKKAAIDEFPWMTMIFYNIYGIDFGFACGGSLINNRYVLTAAHCVTGLNGAYMPITVRLGEWKTTTNPDCDENNKCAPPVIELEIEKIIPHENYDASNGASRFNDDIALLRLNETVDFTQYIQPICLPTSNELRNSNYEGENMKVSGWGITETKVKSEDKLYADLTVAPFNTWKQNYKQLNVVLNDKQLFAGVVNGIDSCQGDSGGPLFRSHKDTTTGKSFNFIAGIVSFGSKTCGIGMPGVYTKVNKYLEWIKSHMEP